MKKNTAIAFLIFATALIIRLYNLPQNQYFSAADEHISYLIRQIVTLKHFPLIGLSAADTGIYLGPLFLYLSALPYALLNNDPLAGGFFSVFLGALTATAIFVVVLKIKNQRTAVIASFLYTFSSFAISNDQHFWNVSPLPLIVVLSLYCLEKIIVEKMGNYLIFLAILLSFGLACHLSILALIIVSLVILWVNKNLIKKKTCLLAILVFFILSVFPIIVFDIRHNFQDTKAAVNLFFSKYEKPYNLVQSFQNTTGFFIDSASRFIYKPGLAIEEELSDCQAQPLIHSAAPSAVKILVLLSFIWAMIKTGRKKADLSDLFSLLLIAVTLGLLILQRNWLHEHYFFILVPAIFLIFADFLGGLPYKAGKATSLILVIGLIALNFKTIINSANKYGLTEKKAVVKSIINEVGKNPFLLNIYGPCHNYGFRYLFTYYGIEPSASYMDNMFSWLYDKKDDRKTEITVDVFVSGPFKDEKIEKAKDNSIKTSYKNKTIGNISIYYAK